MIKGKTRKPDTAAVLAALLLFASLMGCQLIGSTRGEVPQAVISEVTEVIVADTTAPGSEAGNPTVHFFAAGDNLIHSNLYLQAAERDADGGYDFDYAYENVAAIIPQRGIRLLNQETVIANDIYPPSGYPRFNSPTQLGDKMLSLGFNVFNHANNHALDQGVPGLLATFDFWDSRNAVYCGAYRDDEDMGNIRLIEENGVVFSFLGFTYGTNDPFIPSNSDIRIIYTDETEKMQAQVEVAAELSDVVVVSVHWGRENYATVYDIQRTLARQLADWGADIIIGTHPHTVQTIEYLEKENGSDAIVFYSLGNFISAQSRPYQMVGMVADFNITFDLETETISFSDVKAIPIITHYESGYRNIRNYPYNLYNDELASVHGVRDSYQFSMSDIDEFLESIVPEEFLYSHAPEKGGYVLIDCPYGIRNPQNVPIACP